MTELNAQIKAQLESVMRNEVAQVAKETESDMVEKEVYDRYRPTEDGEPWIYKRRGTDQGSGGLGDINQMETSVSRTVHGVEMTVANHATGQQESGMEIAPLVEGGDGAHGLQYQHKGDGTGNYLKPRPFQEEAQTELENSGKAVDALKRGLRARGVDVF